MERSQERRSGDQEDGGSVFRCMFSASSSEHGAFGRAELTYSPLSPHDVDGAGRGTPCSVISRVCLYPARDCSVEFSRYMMAGFGAACQYLVIVPVYQLGVDILYRYLYDVYRRMIQ